MSQLHDAAVFAMEHVTPVSRRSTDHGVRHWHDVARVGYMLMEVSDRMGVEPGHIDSDVVFLFAAFHDTQRLNEFDDAAHGNRAEDVAQEMRDRAVFPLTNAQFETLSTALGDHDRGYTTEDPTIAICWDADRLTLPRVGIKPKKTLMSSAVVKHDFDMCLGFAMFIVRDRDLSWSEIAQLYEGREKPAIPLPRAED
jgi:uncharacterized protein